MNGKNINLRAVEIADLDLLYKWENDDTLWNLSNTITPFSRFVLEQYIITAQQDIYTTKQLRLMIDLKVKENEVQTIGSIDLFDFEPTHKRAGVGIMIDKDSRHKGYASEALELLKEYAFNVLNFHQLYCNITSDNDISLNLFKKANFEISGLKKQWLFVDKKWCDEFILQLINTD